jgi:hypothetical protein
MLGEALTDTVAETDATIETALGEIVALSVALADTDADELDDDVIPVPKILKGWTSTDSVADGSRFVLISRTHITARLLALDGNATEKGVKKNDDDVTLPIFTASLVVNAASGAVTTTRTKDLRPASVKPPLIGVETETSTLIAWYPVVDVQN